MGNSSAKWRLLSEGAVITRGSYLQGDVESRDALLGCAESVDQVWVSSVAATGGENHLTALVEQRWGLSPWYARTSARSGELVNSYTDPSRMGVDRWLAMLGARARSTDRLCVVDAGSALTIDLVSPDGAHEGGYIIPGVALMERALLLDTDRVRFDEDVDYALSPGRSTAEAVRHGVALAQVGSVATVLDSSGTRTPQLFFTGGAGDTLRKMLGRGGELVPDLVFEGLEVMARQAGL
ncbi:type III pantothenate kinase [Halioglobus maricola]|uniref:Type III pantothenate kinase n=1 Tax=Halioglobus maricola TaxID=2601894 RepID=A0A5P9NPI3_9GAMM|nr:type III pantothenate kinase [Halioglobus maricola]